MIGKPEPEDDFILNPLGLRFTPPGSPGGMLAVARRLRDKYLSPLRFGIEHHPSKNRVIVDCKKEDIPKQPSGTVFIEWENQLGPTITWTERMGVVGPAMILSKMGDKGSIIVLGMVQLGGIEVTEQLFKQLGVKAYLKTFQTKRVPHRRFLLLLEQYFLTAHAINAYLPEKVNLIQNEGALWQSCLDEDFSKAARRSMEVA